VHNAFGVQFSNSQCNLSSIKFDSCFIKSLLALENLIKFSSLDKGHNKVKSQFGLKQEVHSDQKGMVSCKKDVFFEDSALDLVIFDQNVFSYSLDGVKLLINVQFCEIDSAKGTTTDLLKNLEIVERNLSRTS
jgi:hypothetical protein